MGILLVLLVVPGGLSGVIWLAAGGAVVTLAALGLPAALSMLRETIAVDGYGSARFAEMTGARPNLPFEPAMVAIASRLALPR